MDLVSTMCFLLASVNLVSVSVASTDASCVSNTIRIGEECRYKYEEYITNSQSSTTAHINKVCKALNTFFLCIGERRKYIEHCHPLLLNGFDRRARMARKQASEEFSCISASQRSYLLNRLTLALMPLLAILNYFVYRRCGNSYILIGI